MTPYDADRPPESPDPYADVPVAGDPGLETDGPPSVLGLPPGVLPEREVEGRIPRPFIPDELTCPVCGGTGFASESYLAEPTGIGRQVVMSCEVCTSCAYVLTFWGRR